VQLEVSTGHQPDAGGDKLLAATQAKAPGLTAEFVKKHDLTPEFLAAVARGEESPPPVPGDGDLHYTPGGWVNAPKGVTPEDAHRNKISR
jgi:hypothetical protein